MLQKIVIIFVLIISHFCSNSQDIIINEVMPSNNNFIFDEDGDDCDWIEIHNKSNNPVNLKGYFLSDNLSNPIKWAFPDIEIEAKGYLLVFASGKDRANINGELHTNFKVSAEGEELYLSYYLNILQEVPKFNLKPNFSYGFINDGIAPFVVFATATPGYTNNNSVANDYITFNYNGGIYDNTFSVEMQNILQYSQIYYTINGNSPDTNSYLYYTSMPISSLYSDENIYQIQNSINNYFYIPDSSTMLKAIVIRAAAFDSLGNRLSEVFTNSYFIKELGINHHTLPIISITAEHKDLFDDTTGIFVPGIYFDESEPFWTGNYYQTGEEWERLINVEYYNHNSKGFNQNAGIRTHGGNSRRYSQKGLRLYARYLYGRNTFDYKLFETKNIESFKRLVLKPFYASWSMSGFEDYMTNLMTLNTEIDAIASKPVVVYINGEYWGVYYLQERIDENFLSENYSINPDSVDIIENWHGLINHGCNESFFELYNFIDSTDLSIAENYEIIENWIDIDNFIDYQIFEIYTANFDWPANNMKCWREVNDDAKWRWIFYDGDAALILYDFEGFEHALSTSNDYWPTNAHSTLFLRKLLHNNNFNNRFFNRMEYLINNYFNYSTNYPILNKAVNDIYIEINNQINRFNFPTSFWEWEFAVNKIDSFIQLRSCIMQQQVYDRFQIILNIDNCILSKVENIEISDIVIYPNPNNGDFNISFNTQETTNVTIEIYNLMGQKVISQIEQIDINNNIVKFNNANLPEGLLIVNVIYNNKIVSFKMLCIK